MMDTTKETGPLERENPRIDTRRHVLLRVPGLMALGSLTAVSLGWPMLVRAQTQSGSMKGGVNILNVALGLKCRAITTYQVDAESGLLQKPILAAVVKLQGHHKIHVSVLTDMVSKLDGTPVMEKKVAEYNPPVNQLRTQTDVLCFVVGLEKGVASAYLRVMPSFYTRDLAKTAVNTLGGETMHWVVLLSALGEDPVPMALIN